MARISPTLLLTLPVLLLASAALPRPASAFSWPSFFSSLGEEDVSAEEVMKYKAIIEASSYETTDSAFSDDDVKPTKEIMKILIALGYEGVEKVSESLIKFQLDDDLDVFTRGKFTGHVQIYKDSIMIAGMFEAPKFANVGLKMMWLNSWSQKKRFTTIYLTENKKSLMVEQDVILSESVAANAKVLKRALGIFAVSVPMAIKEMYATAKLDL